MISPSPPPSSVTDIETYLATWKPQPIEQAQSFPAQMYTSETVYRLEQERIFNKAWLYAGHISQLEQPGSYFTLTLAEQPLVIVMDAEGQLRGFFNVCPHRAGPVAIAQGTCTRLTCQYHAWTFDLHGELKAVPHMESAQNFNWSHYALKPIQVDTWGPFIFVNLDPNGEPLAAQLGKLPDLFQRYNFSKLAKVHSEDYYVDVNWKLYVENSSESYHVAMVHPSLDLFRNIHHIELETQHHSYLEYFPFLPNNESHYLTPGLFITGLNDRELNGSSVALVYPNFVLVVCPNFVLARMIDPQGLSKTHIRFDWLVPDTDAARSPANLTSVVGLYDKVVNEDLQMLATVQQGMRSLSYLPGRLSPLLEVGTHRFQEIIMEYLR
ncbi:aromatic ring-hydroxylating dioxygenase subunit alpha [Oculatella sp. LEGE 06141]|uniref:aromatic ring-hydroxylating oxygenase subunit alpha n=1 Tax=Oculatella sp. LEGE 06141 TaxID=1828648 RepID=UPI00187F8C2F|nr:aromatic ring-hydroxylating dioxygenase subunit alpha [Oculatella sp. LEGE 06141]MBE9178947.1 aromatic ring-hydroxylating dioxygenase subunit alpha [Oculatella sp. LEGE 06141]